MQELATKTEKNEVLSAWNSVRATCIDKIIEFTAILYGATQLCYWSTFPESIIPAKPRYEHCVANINTLNRFMSEVIQEKEATSIAFLLESRYLLSTIQSFCNDTDELHLNIDRLLKAIDKTTPFPKDISAAKLSHHGAREASSSYFLNQLNPVVAFISNGPYNTHGHPHQEVIDRLEANWADITDSTKRLNFYTISGESDKKKGGTSKFSELNPGIAQLPRSPAYVDTYNSGEKHSVIRDVDKDLGTFQIILQETNFLRQKETGSGADVPEIFFCKN